MGPNVYSKKVMSDALEKQSKLIEELRDKDKGTNLRLGGTQEKIFAPKMRIDSFSRDGELKVTFD